MDKNGYEEQKCITVCNEIIEFLKKDNVVYLIKENNRGTNIHVEWEQSVSELILNWKEKILLLNIIQISTQTQSLLNNKN